VIRSGSFGWGTEVSALLAASAGDVATPPASELAGALLPHLVLGAGLGLSAGGFTRLVAWVASALRSPEAVSETPRPVHL
jgi:hypothetical protein